MSAQITVARNDILKDLSFVRSRKASGVRFATRVLGSLLICSCRP
jgi:hypothetical protein